VLLRCELMQTYSIKADRRLARGNPREGNNSLSILTFSSFLSSTFVFGNNTRNLALSMLFVYSLISEGVFSAVPPLHNLFISRNFVDRHLGVLRPDFSELVGIIGCLSLNDTNRHIRHFVLLDQMNNKDRMTASFNGRHLS